MAVRDLVYKIIPSTAIIRDLKTSQGKILTKDSEYTLLERKKEIKVGKNASIDYVYELDLAKPYGKDAEESKQ